MKLYSPASLVVAAVVLSGSSTAIAQTRPVQSAAPVTVIVTQMEPLPRLGNLRDFVSTLLQLQLAQAGFVRVSKAVEEPPCTADSANVTTQGIGPASSQQVPFYIVRFDLHNEPTATPAMVRLDYQLVQVKQCAPRELAHSSDTFAEAEVLQNLRVATDVVALLLQTDAVRLPTIELALDVTGSAAQRNNISNELASRILRSLIASGDLDARLGSSLGDSPADYRVTARLEFQDARVSVRYTIQPQSGEPVMPPTVTGLQTNLASFYDRALTSVVGVLDDLRFSRAAGLSQRLTALGADELRTTASQLLCLPSPEKGCVPQPKEAEPVLARLVEETQTVDAYEWLGVAQLGTGKYSAAADSFAKGLPKTTDEGTRLRLTRLNADASYEARRFDVAADQYQAFENLRRKVTPAPAADPQLYVRWARSVRLGGRGVGRAVDVLIQGLTTPGIPGLTLQTEFRDLLTDVHGAELAGIYRKLQATDPRAVTPLFDPIRRALARDYLSAAETAYGRGDYSAMDASLGDAEALSNNLSADPASREGMARLRGLWLRDRQGRRSTANDFALAEVKLKEALGWDPMSRRAQYALAVTYSNWPNDPAAGNQERLNQAKELLTELTLGHYPIAASTLRSVNGLLKQPDQTRKTLEQAVATDPTDWWALTSLMGVCTDDLFAFDCAVKAAEMLESIELSRRDADAQLNIAEIEVLADQRSRASERLDRVLAAGDTVVRLRVVALFYETWIAYLEQPDADHTALLENWRKTLVAMRQDIGGINWVFGGARYVIENANAFNVAQATELRNMITEMEKTGPY